MKTRNRRSDRFSQVFETVETHTAGEPTRIVLSGFPQLAGESMMDIRMGLEAQYDHLRSALMCEPRGHSDMVGALFVPPIDPRADLGVVFMDANRWINMCGHAAIGCATAAVECGFVPICEPQTRIVLETPAGLVVNACQGREKVERFRFL